MNTHLKFFIYFLVLFLVYSGCSFAGLPWNVLVPFRGIFNLNLDNQRPAAPYPVLENYNITLTQHGPSPEYPVRVSRHHIIPLNTLRNFFNAVVQNGELPRLRLFLNRLATK